MSAFQVLEGLSPTPRLRLGDRLVYDLLQALL